MIGNLASQFLWVALGGALGAVARFATGLWLGERAGFPLATFAVNLAGSFLIGVIVMLTLEHAATSRTRLLLVTGILGGFTTFSAFSLEVGEMLMTRRAMDAAFYAAVSVMFCVGAMLAGAFLTRALVR